MRILALILMVAAFLLLGYIAWLNPSAVDFSYSGTQSLRVPLGWLVIFGFLIGGATAGMSVAAVRLFLLIREWPERRRERAAQRLDEWEDAAAQLIWEGDLERARNLLARAWRRQRDRSDTAMRLASTYADAGEFATARRILEEAVEHDPSSPELRCALAHVLESQGDTTEAIRLLETVRLQHPRAVQVLTDLRRLYERAGRWAEAARVQQAYLDAVLPARHDETERTRLISFHCRAALADANASSRFAALSRLLESHPQSVPVIVSLGDALVEMGRPDEAVKLWEKSLRDTPRTVLIERLVAHLPGGRERERVANLARKSRTAINLDRLHAVLARFAIAENDFDAAAAMLEQVRQQDNSAVQRLWAQVHRQRGQTEQALRAYSRACEADDARITGYRCIHCQREQAHWSSACENCGKWDGLRSALEVAT